MKFSLRWLKDYVTFDLTVESLIHRLTMAGLEVEKVEKIGEDTVLELEITPNRPDCLNMIGMAREIAAILAKPLKIPPCPAVPALKKKCEIAVEDKEGCLRYMGTLIENVQVGPAADWLAERLTALGVRLINNVVDITNFCLFETGQPLHAFDYDKLQGGRIVVRRAKKGEKIVTIDGIERTLDSSVLVIADAVRPVAIAGIMGGKDTEVTAQTKNILLESAYFDPVLIRRGCRKIGLASDSSYRFERGVDWPTVELGALRAISLIVETAGGAVIAKNDISLTSQKTKTPAIKVSSEAVNALLGVSLPAIKMQAGLKRLGCDVKINEKKQMVVTPPSFRGDIKNEVDVIEEVARMIGYDKLPTSLPQIKFASIPVFSRREFKKKLGASLAAQGLNEVVTYSLISREALEKAQLADQPLVRVQNPLSQEQEIMRPTLLPSFLNVARTNFSRGERNLRLFELGKIYLPSGEREVLGLCLSGSRYQDWRIGGKERVEFYDLKGFLENSAQQLSLSALSFAPANEKSFSGGETAIIFFQGKRIGTLGKIDPAILSLWDIKHDDVYFAELDLENILKTPAPRKAYHPYSEYPAIVRDVSVAIRQDIPYAHLQTLIQSLNIVNLSAITFKEQYVGDKIPVGCRGVTFSLLFQSSERTLTEEKVQQSHATICQALVEKLGAVLR